MEFFLISRAMFLIWLELSSCSIENVLGDELEIFYPAKDEFCLNVSIYSIF